MAECYNCKLKFGAIGVLWEKKNCKECEEKFCSNCAPVAKELLPNRRSYDIHSPRICLQCRILSNPHPKESDLMMLKIGALQRYLAMRNIPIGNCVEKKDLVDLVMSKKQRNSMKSNITQSSHSSSSTALPTNANVSSQGRGIGRYNHNPTAENLQPFATRRSRAGAIVERQNQDFPKNYVESTHRQDFLESLDKNESAKQENLNETQQDGVREQNQDFTQNYISSTHRQAFFESLCRNEPTEQANQTEPSQHSSVERQNRDFPNRYTQSTHRQEFFESLRMNELTEQESQNDTPQSEDVLGAQATLNDQRRCNIAQGEHVEDCGHYSNWQGQDTRSASTDELAQRRTRNFEANDRIRMNLSEIKSPDDIQELHVRQLKYLLATNKVNFKGATEKEELVKRVKMLWTQKEKDDWAKDTMENTELCKICMDNPVDCVMLECGHMCACITCGKQLAECPICREYIVRIVKTFKS